MKITRKLLIYKKQISNLPRKLLKIYVILLDLQQYVKSPYPSPAGPALPGTFVGEFIVVLDVTEDWYSPNLIVAKVYHFS